MDKTIVLNALGLSKKMAIYQIRKAKMKTHLQKLPLFLAFISLYLFGCSPREATINGQVFIVTEGGENLKLGLVVVSLIESNAVESFLKNYQLELAVALAKAEANVAQAKSNLFEARAAYDSYRTVKAAEIETFEKNAKDFETAQRSNDLMRAELEGLQARYEALRDDERDFANKRGKYEQTPFVRALTKDDPAQAIRDFSTSMKKMAAAREVLDEMTPVLERAQLLKVEIADAIIRSVDGMTNFVTTVGKDFESLAEKINSAKFVYYKTCVALLALNHARGLEELRAELALAQQELDRKRTVGLVFNQNQSLQKNLEFAQKTYQMAEKAVSQTYIAPLFLSKLPPPAFREATTDADGKFVIAAPARRQFAAFAQASRRYGDTTNAYTWFFWLPKNLGEAPIFLSNNNLLTSSNQNCILPQRSLSPK